MNEDEPEPGLDLQRHSLDYERTCDVVKTLTDVRLRLAAFVPIVTGAAAALITTSDRESLTAYERAFLAGGGLLFMLGIVIYDLRNSQHYNSAVGRAQALEDMLGFEQIGDDAHVGVYGTRRDSSRNLRTDGRHRLWHFIPIRHGTGLAAVYGAATAAWAWVLAAAITMGQGWTDHGRWIPISVGAAVFVLYVKEYSRIDHTDLGDRSESEPTA